MPSPLRPTGVQSKVSMTGASPTASSSGGGGGSGLTLSPDYAKRPDPPPAGGGTSAPLVFPSWLKWALIGGAALILWNSKKKGSSLGNLLSPAEKRRRLREFHINEESRDDDEADDEEEAEYEEID